MIVPKNIFVYGFAALVAFSFLFSIGLLLSGITEIPVQLLDFLIFSPLNGLVRLFGASFSNSEDMCVDPSWFCINVLDHVILTAAYVFLLGCIVGILSNMRRDKR